MVARFFSPFRPRNSEVNLFPWTGACYLTPRTAPPTPTSETNDDDDDEGTLEHGSPAREVSGRPGGWELAVSEQKLRDSRKPWRP